MQMVAELEYATTLRTDGQVLHHGCGDGTFASLAWSGGPIAAGCDTNAATVELARRRASHGRLDVCDTTALPYGEGNFDLVFSNGTLARAAELDRTLQEISRVLAKGGVFAFTALNQRYFHWWPLTAEEAAAYRSWHPIYWTPTLADWRCRLEAAGLSIESVQGYFDKSAARLVAKLDYAARARDLVSSDLGAIGQYFKHPKLLSMYISTQCSESIWMTRPDEGAGYFIQARKV
jgi:SAM-dependent methyltransferase